MMLFNKKKKNYIVIFREFTKPNEPVKKRRKELTLTNAIIFINGRQEVLNTSQSEIFPKGKKTYGKRRQNLLGWVAKVFDPKQLKILTPT